MKESNIEATKKNHKASITAFTVAYALARTMHLRPNVMQHFGIKVLRVTEQILMTAHREESFRFNLNSILNALVYRAPFRFQNWFFNKVIASGYDTFITARKLVIEKLIYDHINNNVEQIVFLGGGYDPRPLLTAIQHPNIQVYEIDQPGSTRDQKLSALKSISSEFKFQSIQVIDNPYQSTLFNENLHCIACDIHQNNLLNILQLNNFDPNKKTLVIAEGLTMYLTKKTVENLLEDLCSILSSSSHCFISFLSKKNENALLKARLKSSGEEYNFTLDPRQAVEFFKSKGLYVKAKYTTKTSMTIEPNEAIKTAYSDVYSTPEPYVLLNTQREQKDINDFALIPEVVNGLTDWLKLTPNKINVITKKDETILEPSQTFLPSGMQLSPTGLQTAPKEIPSLDIKFRRKITFNPCPIL